MLSKVIDNAFRGVHDLQGLEDAQKYAQRKKDLETFIDEEIKRSPKDEENLEKVSSNCLQEVPVIEEVSILLQDFILKAKGSSKKKFKEIRDICLGKSIPRVTRLIQQKKKIEESLKNGDNSDNTLDFKKYQIERLLKVEYQLKEISRVAERFERILKAIPLGEGDAREKISIWLGLALLEIRYTVEGELATTNVAIVSKTPAMSAKKIWENVNNFTDIYKSDPNKSDSDVPGDSL